MCEMLDIIFGDKSWFLTASEQSYFSQFISFQATRPANIAVSGLCSLYLYALKFFDYVKWLPTRVHHFVSLQILYIIVYNSPMQNFYWNCRNLWQSKPAFAHVKVFPLCLLPNFVYTHIYLHLICAPLIWSFPSQLINHYVATNSWWLDVKFKIVYLTVNCYLIKKLVIKNVKYSQVFLQLALININHMNISPYSLKMLI